MNPHFERDNSYPWSVVFGREPSQCRAENLVTGETGPWRTSYAQANADALAAKAREAYRIAQSRAAANMSSKSAVPTHPLHPE